MPSTPRPSLRATAALAAVLFTAALAPACAREVFTGKCTAVFDGDTIEVLREGREVRVRLEGIDAPERGQDFSTRSRQHLASLVFGKAVHVTSVGTDRYERILGRVRLGGLNVNEEMVRAGLAWHYKRYSSDRRLAALESEARAAARGLWVATRPMPPWDHRRIGRELARPAPSPRISSGPYHGNTSSHRFHRATCEHYRCKNCTQVFATRKEALAAGYLPCGRCKP